MSGYGGIGSSLKVLTNRYTTFPVYDTVLLVTLNIARPDMNNYATLGVMLY